MICDLLQLHGWLCNSYLTISLVKSGSIILELDYDGLRKYPTVTPQPEVDYEGKYANYIKIIGVDIL